MLQRLVKHNSGYYAHISNLEKREWGNMLYNPQIPQHIDSNHAEGFSTNLRAMPRVVAEVEDFYRQHGLTPRFRINQFDQPQGMESFLAQRNYVLRPASYRIMLWDNIPFAPILRPGITVEKVGPHNRPEALHIIMGERSWGTPEVIAAVFAREYASTNVDYYLVRRDGAPAATGFLYYQGGLAKIENVRTLPQYRGQYCASALVRHIQGEFTDRGGEGLYLLAGDAVKGLYLKQGFVDLGGVQELNAFLP